MTGLYTIKKVKKTREATDKIYSTKFHATIAIYKSLPKPKNRNLMIAKMLQTKWNHGAGFEDIEDARLFVKHLQQEGFFQFDE
jgi:hypothetical protein